jgi:hypothetical protein
VNNSNCSGLNSLCRSGNCVNPAEEIGYASGTGSVTLVTGNLYLIKLPLITHNGTLTDFGIVTTASAAASSVKLGLYGADGSGLPTGIILDYTSTTITVGSGKLVQVPGIPYAIAPGQYYLAVSTNTASSISIQSSSSTGAGYKLADTYNSTPSIWPNLSGISLVAYSNQLAVFIDVADTN